jgi:hypothetical protein
MMVDDCGLSVGLARIMVSFSFFILVSFVVVKFKSHKKYKIATTAFMPELV